MAMILGSLLMTLLAVFASATSRSYFSPSVVLCAVWAGVYLLQTMFAPAMYSSALAALVAAFLAAAFLFGELFGRSLTAPDRRASSYDADARFRRRLAFATATFGVLALALLVPFFSSLGLLESGELVDAFATVGGRLRQEALLGEIEVPFAARVFLLFAFPGVVLSLVYLYFYGWRWWLLLPTIAVILAGLSLSGKMGTVIVITQWLIAFVLRDLGTEGAHARNVAKLAGRLGLAAVALAVMFVSFMMLRLGVQSLDAEALG
jgi:oligosaccharide repeat unit polymerase